MFDDLSDLSLDTNFLEAIAVLDLGDGAVSAHDVDAITQVLGDSLKDVSSDFTHLSPDAAVVLHDALGVGSDALGNFGPESGQVDFVDPFGEGPGAEAGSSLVLSDLSVGIYTDAQYDFAETGMNTDSGFAFLPDAQQDWVSDVPEYPGEYVLVTHGTESSVAADGVELSAPDFAEVIVRETDWNGEDPIRLVSCSTGGDADGFAQQLADELGINVTAATEEVHLIPDGEPIVGDGVFDPWSGCYLPPVPPTGGWLTFLPRAV